MSDVNAFGMQTDLKTLREVSPVAVCVVCVLLCFLLFPASERRVREFYRSCIFYLPIANNCRRIECLIEVFKQKSIGM